jgi:hypothetical protein
MGKRAANQAAPKVTTKKPKVERPKVDPALASIADAIAKADHLPENCRAMLIDLIPLSLALPADARLEGHSRVVEMIEEILQASKAGMESDVEAENTKLENEQRSLTELANAAAQAEAAVASQKEAVDTAKGSLADASAVTNASWQSFTEQQSVQKSCDATLISTKEEKLALETAMNDHFKTPMEAAAGPNLNGLEPFLHKLELDPTLLTTLPLVCAKTKENRSTFDDAVLADLEKAISSKLAGLNAVVEAETPAAIEREAATKELEAQYVSKKEAQTASEADLVGAQTLLCERQAAFQEAKEAVDKRNVQVAACAGSHEKAQNILKAFENGALAHFMTCKSKSTVPAEALPAGA